MKVTKIRDATTRESPVRYELTIDISTFDLRSKTFDLDLVGRVLKAIESLACDNE